MLAANEGGLHNMTRGNLRPAAAPPVAALSGPARLLFFFLLLGAAALALNAGITSGLRQVDTSEFGVWNAVIGGRANADIVVSGSSRALAHYDSRIIGAASGRTVFNIGLNGAQTDMQVARVKAYLAHNRKPALLIHNLDAFSFEVTHGGVYDPGQYVPYLDEPALYSALQRIDPAVWKSRWLPLYGYAVDDPQYDWVKGLKRLTPARGAEDHFLGFNPRHYAWTGDFERFRAEHPAGRPVAIEPEGVRQMEDLLRTCQAQGIRVALVYSPEFAPAQALTTNRAEVMARFADLSRRYGATLIDYSRSALSTDQANFYNSQHLNADGAEKFSRDLSARLAHEGIVPAARDVAS